MQDKVNQKITAALAVKLTAGEKALVTQKGTNDPAAYEEFLRGREHYLRFTKEDFTKAQTCFKRAIELDPHNPAHYLTRIGLAHFCMGEWQEAVTASQKALKLNPEIGGPVAVLASACAHLGRTEEAKAAYQVWRQRQGSARIPMFFRPFKDRRVEDSFVEGCIKAGFPSGWLVSIHVSKEDQLTGEDLREFYFPSTTNGYSGEIGEWTLEIARDGTAILRSTALPGEVDSGRSWVEGDKLWLQFQKHHGGIAYCSTTFRNPTGTPELKNEYISFTDVDRNRFSRVR